MTEVAAAGLRPDPAADSAAPRIRLLCLHGYHGSGGLLRTLMSRRG